MSSLASVKEMVSVGGGGEMGFWGVSEEQDRWSYVKVEAKFRVDGDFCTAKIAELGFLTVQEKWRGHLVAVGRILL